MNGSKGLRASQSLLNDIDEFLVSELGALRQHKEYVKSPAKQRVTREGQQHFYDKMYRDGMEFKRYKEKYQEFGEMSAVLLSNAVHTDSRSAQIAENRQRRMLEQLFVSIGGGRPVCQSDIESFICRQSEMDGAMLRDLLLLGDSVGKQKIDWQYFMLWAQEEHRPWLGECK